MNDDEKGGVWTLVIIGLLIWGVNSAWSRWANNTNDADSAYYPSTSYRSSECIEPENPYNSGTGHYAGWEWGERGNYCDGNSSSFIEGCEEYEIAIDEFESCLGRH